MQGYAERLLAELYKRLGKDFGGGSLMKNLEFFRGFYLVYPDLLTNQISYAVLRKSVSHTHPSPGQFRTPRAYGLYVPLFGN